MLGIPVVVELVKAGFEVTALVRNPENARRLLPAQTIIARADVADIESLKRGLVGQDAVYLSLSIAPTEKEDDFHTEAEGLENILIAVRSCGVQRIAYLSAMIQDGDAKGWWVIDVWRKALARIKSSGIPFTIFYPSNFMETLPQRHGAGRFLALIGTARYPNYWIAGRDFGRQVATSFRTRRGRKQGVRHSRSGGADLWGGWAPVCQAQKISSLCYHNPVATFKASRRIFAIHGFQLPDHERGSQLPGSIQS